MQIQTTVVIDRDWQDRFAKDDESFVIPTAYHISVDPITGVKSATLYTDDGRGNGTPILSFEMRD